MNRQKRSVVRISLYVGMPLLCAMAIYNLIKGNHFLSVLICAMLLIVILLGFVTRRRIDEKFEYKIYSILFRLLIAAVGIALLYEIGLQSNFSRIGWCYLFPLLVFFVVPTGEGIIWVSIFYGILAFLILNFDLQGITLFQLQELRYRFLISLFVACILSLLLEHGFRHAQQRLLNHQRNLKESENRYRQAYEQLNTQMQERKQAEEALRESEEKYRTILENIEDGYYEVDLAGNFTLLNDSMCRIWGYPKEELMGMNNRQYTDKENARRLFQAFNKAYKTGEPGRVFDYEIIRKDGTKRYVETSFSLIKDSSGKPIGVRGIIRDVTERKQAEEALRESEEKYRTILENIDDGYYEVDLAGKFTFFNDSMCRIYGYPREEFMGISYRQYTDQETAKEVFKAYNRVYRTGEPGRGFDHEIIRKDGTKGYIEASISLLKDSSSKPIGFRGIIRDVTERKRAEEALREKTEELAQSNKDLEQFAYVASHDLQEPLRMVTSYVQLLARRYKGKLDSDADEFIKFATDGAVRMQKLINDLLTYSRVSTQGKELEPTDCETVFNQSLNNLKVAIDENGALVTHDSLPTVMADNPQLVELFQNLIGNAIKFRGAEPPRVHVSASRNGNGWTFSVRDNGIGIAPEYAKRIFVIFQRFHSREKYAGTGIGLAICQKIVEQHRGRIWVESEVGKGATFYFTLPASKAEPLSS
jgi:PAS domain S-box-containing protein